MEQQDEIKQLLQVNNKKAQGSVRLESDILEPSSSSESHALFTLRKAGILSNDSRILLPLYASNGTTRLTCFGGAYAVIQRATLRTSNGVVIAQTDDAHFLASMRNHFVPQEIRSKVGKYKNGCYNNYSYNSDSNGYKGVVSLEDTTGGDQLARDKLGQASADRVEYVISLQELFPELFPYSIPLFALEGNVQLALDFADNGATGYRGVASDGNNANIGDVSIDLPNLKFISDHIFMDQPIFDRIIAMSRTQQGLVIPYGDYQLVTATHSAGTAPGANAKSSLKYTDNIGMAGMRLKHLLIHNQLVAGDSQPTTYQKVTGKFGSSDSLAGVGGQQFQFNINNENYYNQNLETQEFFKELIDVYGYAPSIPYPVYTTIGSVGDGTLGDTTSYAFNKNLVDDENFYGTPLRTALCGQACFAGVNFCNPLNRSNTGFNGIEVGNAPITIQYQRDYTADNNHSVQTRYFACIERLMALKNGRIENNFS